MNENDMDRYFWRTGQRWGGDSRPLKHLQNPLRYPPWPKLRGRTILLLIAAYLITIALRLR